VITNSRSLALSERKDIKSALVGAEWESHLDRVARSQQIVPLNLDPPGKWTPHGFRKPKSKFDRVFVAPGAKSIFCDAKTTGSKSFSCGKIELHQLKALMDVGRNAPAGYLVWFRSGDQVVWFNWQLLYRGVTGPDKSLKPEQGILLGGLLSFRFQPIFDLK
jgi:hypothetical protein